MKRLVETLTGIAERAVTVMAIRCHDATALERKLHQHFARKGRHHNEGGGREWFKCRPEEILEAVGMPLTQIR